MADRPVYAVLQGAGIIPPGALQPDSVVTSNIVNGAVKTAKIDIDGDLDMNNNRITNLVISGSQSAVPKNYVDGTGGSVGSVLFRKHGIMVSVWTNDATNGETLPVGFRPTSVVAVGGISPDPGFPGTRVTIGTNGVISITGSSSSFLAATFSTV